MSHDDESMLPVPQAWLIFQFGEMNRRLDKHSAEQAAGFATLSFDLKKQADDARTVMKRVEDLENHVAERQDRRRRTDKILLACVSAPWMYELGRILLHQLGTGPK